LDDRRRYVELQCTSHFSFLRAPVRAMSLLIKQLSSVHRSACDRRPQFPGRHRFAPMRPPTAGVRLIVGCRLDLDDGLSVLVYPTDRAAMRLCRLLSLGKKRGGKAKCRLDWSDLVTFSEGLIAVLAQTKRTRPAR